MRSAISAALVAFVSSVLAQTPDFDPVTEPALNQAVPAGQTFNIQWTAAPSQFADSLIDISLIGGATQKTLQPVSTIATGIKNSAGTYAWAVDPSLGTDAVYGLVLTLESDTTTFQYSDPFTITPSGNSNSSTTTLTSTSGTQTVSLSNPSSTLSNNFTSAPKSTLTVTKGSSPTTSSTTTSSTGAAAHATAGAMVALGGFALAALAL